MPEEDLPELTAAADRLRAANDINRTPIVAIEARGTRVIRHRRVLASSVATLVVLAVGLSALVVASQSDGKSTPIHAAEPKGPSPAAATPEQIAAHLGVGAPEGWVPVDFGAARFYVPAQTALTRCPFGEPGVPPLYVLRAGPQYGTVTCETTKPTITMMSLSHPSLGEAAGGAGAPTPTIPASSQPPASTTRVVTMPSTATVTTIHGYAVGMQSNRLATSYIVPALDLEIATGGDASLISNVLATLAPSAVSIARNPANAASTEGWKRVAFDHVSIKVPSTWDVLNMEGRGEGCGPTPNVVKLGIGIAPSCRALMNDTAGSSVGVDSARLTSSAESAASLTGEDAFTIDGRSAYQLEVGDNSLSILIPSLSVELDLSTGRDGRIGAAILASFAADRGTDAVTPPNCPAAQPTGGTTPFVNGTDTQLVPLTPAAVEICRYNGLNGTDPSALAGHTVGNPAGLATALDELTASTEPAPSCPMDDGSADVLRFVYPSGSSLDVRVSRSGCQFASNGVFTAVQAGPVVALDDAALGGEATTSSLPTTTATTGTTTVQPVPPPAVGCAVPAPTSVATHQRAGTNDAMVPGSPLSVFVCSYGVASKGGVQLGGQGSGNPGALQAALNALSTLGPFHCVNDFASLSASLDLLRFQYSDGGVLDVMTYRSGCGITTNGDRAAGRSDAVTAAVNTIVGP